MSNDTDQDLFYPNDELGKYVIEASIKLRTRNHLYKAFIPPNTGKIYYVIKAFPYNTTKEKHQFDYEQQILAIVKDFNFILQNKEIIEQKVITSINENGNQIDREITFMCTVMDFCDYFDLRDFYGRSSFKRPELRCKIFYKTLQILKNIHDRRIVHHDIKGQNFLVREIDPLDIVLTDFEFATILGENETSTRKCGTLQFMAPEVLNGEDHDMACDIWSLGVMMYKFCRGVFPFGISNDDTIDKIRDKISRKKITFGKLFDRDMGHLIMRMLEKDQYKRITAEEALNHIYFKKNNLEETTKEMISEMTAVEKEENAAKQMNDKKEIA